jgi:hypothetical protein
MASWSLKVSDSEELAQRVARIRQYCDELEKALGAGAQQRNLLVKIRRDADDVYRSLTAAKTAD